MATPPTPTPTLNFFTVLSESKRIINAHSRHFLALSVIFLLPLSFSLIVSPTLFHLLSPSSNSHIHILLRTPTLPLFHHHHHHHHHLNTLLFSLPFSLSLLLISLFSLSSITHSVFHGFFGRPVKLPSAIQSIFPSFFPLLLTTLLSQLTLFSIALLSFLFVHSLYHFAPSLSSTFSILLFLLLFLPPFLYLQLSWTLASVISVVESTYGFEPLNRSSKLMKGMKGIGFSSLLFFGFMEVVLVWGNYVLATNSDGGGGNGASALFKGWASVLQIVLASTLLMLLMLYQTAANTVLYMYCKAVHGELAVEIVEEFASEYVTLPFDDGKIPHLVSVVHV
ncbi:hypothetical protein Lal_00016225 [Lupinus albus]|uniref:Uncharacterized protein n=1 Tax=Lupinus albus TaxID=3870 RepID=A0A6A4QJV1_LUPAL|nr:hypothetical protein Lalb_Chr05g0220171 [Lupinus albus]KAF1873099.1 hypothetical protein Lal_00016225 [Lupinus albus]